VAFGADFVPLAAQLVNGREVALSGRLRSRDVDTDLRRVVTEVVATEIILLGTRSEALQQSSHGLRVPDQSRSGAPHLTTY
jgi:single-stranded DNA-binding protein